MKTSAVIVALLLAILVIGTHAYRQDFYDDYENVQAAPSAKQIAAALDAKIKAAFTNDWNSNTCKYCVQGANMIVKSSCSAFQSFVCSQMLAKNICPANNAICNSQCNSVFSDLYYWTCYGDRNKMIKSSQDRVNGIYNMCYAAGLCPSIAAAKKFFPMSR